MPAWMEKIKDTFTAKADLKSLFIVLQPDNQVSTVMVVCNCGNEFVTGSTKKDIHVEICSKCHSFYTGQQKAASARGRIEMFNRKYGMKTDK